MKKLMLVAALILTAGCTVEEKTDPAPVEHKTEVNVITPSEPPVERKTETNQTTTDPATGNSTTTTTTTTEEKH